MVKNFKKTFINLHHREPTDIEIISNLQDNMIVDTIHQIIEELKNNSDELVQNQV